MSSQDSSTETGRINFPATQWSPGLRNIRLTLEYDGSRYAGWQRQLNGVAVQQVVEEALESLVGHPVRVMAAGRTDAGVHALGQVANFFTISDLPARAISRAVLPFLPDTVAVTAAEEAAPDFDARRCAILRWYRYFVCNRPVRPAVGTRYLSHVVGRLDLDRMRAAADLLGQTHDFSAFRAVTCTSPRTLLDMQPIQIRQLPDDVLQFDYQCRSFLQNMVRILTGTIVACGRGKLEVADIQEMLTTGKRRNEAITLSPNGLFLYRVIYPD